MANIIYDARKIKLMEAVKELSDLVQFILVIGYGKYRYI